MKNGGFTRQNFAKRNLDGFTLVELLVTFGLILIIGTVGTNIIASILRSYNKAHIINEIEQNGNYALSLMESQIRNAGSVSPTDTTTQTLTVTPQEGSTITFSITTGAGGIGVVQRTVEGITEILTNDNLVSGVSVDTTNSQFVISNTTPPSVQIILQLRQAPNAPGRVDYRAETTLQTTVVVRGGYE